MKTNWTNEEVNALLDELESRLIKHWDGGHLGIKDQLKKEKGLLPTIEVEKVYKDPEFEEYMMFITQVGTPEDDTAVIGYGFDSLGDWEVNDEWYNENESPLIEATKEEWETALKEEAIRRGYKEGVTIKSLFDGEEVVITGDNIEFETWDEKPFYTFQMGLNWILADGKWAEIIQPELTTE